MVCIQGLLSKGLKGLAPNLSLLTYQIHSLKPGVAISRCFPKANFMLAHPVSKEGIRQGKLGKKIFFFLK